jgi:hypothetical protein
MDERARNLGEEMALAVLRGDRVAAYALADLLLEERTAGREGMAKAAKALRESYEGAHDGYSVYFWPEFQAFCKRAGILHDLRTVHMTITIKEGHPLVVDHTYQAVDTESPRSQPNRVIPPEGADE